MALLFQRIARNLAKNGFFPTDTPTVERIAAALSRKHPDRLSRFLDPCCGEGRALADTARFTGGNASLYGVEFDANRAHAARARIGHVLWSDFQDTSIENSAFDFLFLNPPYGPLASDRAVTGDEDISRFEELFVRRCIPMLRIGAVMALIIPHYELRPRMCQWLARSFERITVWKGVEDTYKQVVVLAVRRRTVQSGVGPTVEWLLQQGREHESVPTIPPVWNDEPYVIPAGDNAVEPRFAAIDLDPVQLEDITPKDGLLWTSFENLFGQVKTSRNKPPLHQVGEWHMALLLASGEVDGRVVDDHGQAMLLKGNTVKATSKTAAVELDGNGNVAANITTVRERFVAQITAIDITPTSPRFGDVFTLT